MQLVAIALLRKQSAGHCPGKRVLTLLGQFYRVYENTDRAAVIVTSAIMSEHSALGSPELMPSSDISDPIIDYEYKPLPTSPATIRLFSIQPPSSPALEEPVVCEIHHFGLEAAASKQYCALSYAWGEPNFDQTVNINGYGLRITSHLCKALQRLRSYSVKWVWVDAICIDQSNTPERSAQVSLMGRIYSSAGSTVIYLGEADMQEARAVGLMTYSSALRTLLPDAKAADTTMQLTGTVCDTLIDCLGSGHPYIVEFPREGHKQWDQMSDAVSALGDARSRDKKCRLLRALNLPDEGDSLWASLVSLYQRPWFERGWVLQEAVLSLRAIVILGDDQFDFEKLEACPMFFHESGLYYHSILRLPLPSVTPIVIKRIREQSEPRSLVHLLHSLDMCRTTDPRDKIYCLLGIADDVSLAPKPDYSQSVKAVYRSYAVHSIVNCEGLELLRSSGIAQGASRADATWVPCWDRWSLERSVGSILMDSNLVQASASVQAHYAFEESFSLLKVRGVRFDSAGRFCSQTLSSEFHQDWISWEQGISSIVQESPRFSTESYAKALFMDGAGQGTQYFNSAFVAELVLDIANSPYMGRIIETARRFRFVLTSRGYLGWVPEDSKPSDTICIIFGVSVPLLLREVEGGRHIVIGEAYIEGIMGGEAMHDSDLVVEDFTLT